MTRIIGFLFIAALFIQFGCYDKGKYSKEGYELVWHDEFSTEGLPDSMKWSYDISGNEWGWGNNELQFYTSAKNENAEVKNGKLHIQAVKEHVEHKSYTSARLITKNKGDWQYGIVEVKAKVPGGRGLWPAIWMMPTHSDYGIWPESGEIDIMENVGYIPDTIFSAIHTKSYNHGINTQKQGSLYIPDCHSKFHIYKLKWTPDQLETFIDDNPLFTFNNEHHTYKEWPFNKPFYLVLNVAVGGNWGGKQGVDNSIFPQAMLIDYVRVYQKK